jgi:hypothetical protein
MQEYTPHHNHETHDTEESFFVHEKEALHAIKPDEKLLSTILSKLDEEKIHHKDHNPYISRRVHTTHPARGIAILSPYMNYIKMVSGAAFATALVFMFTLKVNDTPGNEPNTFAINARSAKVATVGQDASPALTDIDSLVDELAVAETYMDEPTLDDSQIMTNLSNTNSYEIQ